MVMRVTWRVHRADSGAFDLEDLPVLDRLLALARAVLEDGLSELGIHADQVGNTASMVAMPMCEQDM